jgi:hypothetical protein
MLSKVDLPGFRKLVPGGISPLGLLAGALGPTLIAAIVFRIV